MQQSPGKPPSLGSGNGEEGQLSMGQLKFNTVNTKKHSNE